MEIFFLEKFDEKLKSKCKNCPYIEELKSIDNCNSILTISNQGISIETYQDYQNGQINSFGLTTKYCPLCGIKFCS